MNTTDINFVVDGHQFDDRNSDLLGDGQHAPFYVFDIAKQDYVLPAYQTRAEAQRKADQLNAKV